MLVPDLEVLRKSTGENPIPSGASNIQMREPRLRDREQRYFTAPIGIAAAPILTSRHFRELEKSLLAALAEEGPPTT